MKRYLGLVSISVVTLFAPNGTPAGEPKYAATDSFVPTASISVYT